MPVDDSMNVGLNDAKINLEELDKQATKAVRALEKEQKALAKAKKELERKGGVFTSDEQKEQKKKDKQKQTFAGFKPKEEEGIVPLTGGNVGSPIQAKKTFTEEIKAEVDKKIKVGFREAFADQAGGFRGAQTIFAMGKNPKAFVGNIARSIPLIGGLVAAAEFGQAIIAELEKLDRFFKKFIDIIDTRVNQLRDKVEIAKIRAGDNQEIYTTEAGGTEPRESYNTFNEFNKNRAKLESDFAIRDTSGI